MSSTTNILRKVTARVALLLCSLVAACGGTQNVFKGVEKKEPAEDATLALEKGQPDKAIEGLESALKDDPGNPKYLSILALAYAQRAGIEPLTLATKLGSDSSSDKESGGGGETNGLIALFGVMPDATADNIADIDKAVQLLTIDIAAADRQPGDSFKIAIFQTASMVLHLKALDKDGDGALSVEEITNLNDAGAGGLLDQLTSSQAILAAGDQSSDTNKKAAEGLAKHQDKINEAPGTTREEKLRNYLAGTQAAQSSTTTGG